MHPDFDVKIVGKVRRKLICIIRTRSTQLVQIKFGLQNYAHTQHSTTNKPMYENTSVQ